MKRYELIVRRLFKAARTAPERPIDSMPGHVQTRILAHWRTDAQPDDSFLLLGLLFRRALLGAALVMFVCVAWSYHGLTTQPDNEIALVNYELREDLLP